MKRAIIVSKLSCDISFLKHDSAFKIACDAGYLNFKRVGFEPDLLIGDFDSLKEVPDAIKKIRLNPIKDVTDTEYALNLLISEGYDDISIYGAIGERLDMTLTTVSLLAKASLQGIRIKAFFDDKIIFSLYNSEVSFKEDATGTISVFSFLNEARGVDESNLKYELKDYTLKNVEPLGVSNEFISKRATIRVKDGILIVITKADNL